MMKKKTVKAVVCLLVLVIVASVCALVSCAGREKYSEYYFDCFDTVSTVVGYADSKEEFDEVCALIASQLEEYHRLFDIYNKYEGINNLCTVNSLSNGVHTKQKVDGKIIDLLLYAKEVYVLTDGKVNVAMGSVLSVWHQYREAGRAEPEKAKLPSEDELEAAAEHCDIDDVIIDEAASTVYLRDPEMSLDVGAVAKGYAVECIAKSLEERGITGYVLNVGGNVRTVGDADGDSWSVGIENPDPTSSQAFIATLSLSGESLVTSGSYQRYYTFNGKRYHHIIDPDTLMPAEYFESVSVLCGDSGLGDALSTALFSMDHSYGLALVESLDGVEALWIKPGGEVVYSSGFEEYLTDKRE